MTLRAVLCLMSTGILLVLAPAVPAQLEGGGFVYFPTGDVTDGRMLALGCVNAFDQPNSISISVPAAEPTFIVTVFDGDTGGVDVNGLAHWDLGNDQLLYRLYFDPEITRNTDPENLVAEWTGNDPNPLSNPDPDPDRQWVADLEQMPDNGFWSVTVTPSDLALTANGTRYSYHLVVVVDPDVVCTSAASDFKIGVGLPATFVMNDFGFEGSLRQIPNDGPIIYPEFQLPIPDTRFFLDTPTTFDGTFDFFFQVGDQQVELRIFGGDFDRGTSNLVAVPSMVSLIPCIDTDDPDTPPDYSNFPADFNLAGAQPEAANNPGTPSDDNFLDIFRRGEPGDPDHLGCTRYEVIDPTGTIYRNNNPSGSFEWEQFRVVTHLAENPDLADYGPNVAADGETFVLTDFLPEGTWQVRIFGLDMANINYWSLRTGTCAVVEGQPACIPEEETPPPLPPPSLYEIPTLSPTGLLLMALLLAALALLALRQRQPATSKGNFRKG